VTFGQWLAHLEESDSSLVILAWVAFVAAVFFVAILLENRRRRCLWCRTPLDDGVWHLCTRQRGGKGEGT